MFALHDNTRIAICRAAFVVLCLLPTCGVVAWCVAVQGDDYREVHERALQDRLGWHVQMQDVGLPQPTLTLYEGLEISDAESGQLLAHVPFAEIESAGNETIVSLPFPATVNGLRLDALLRSAERALRTAGHGSQVRLAAQNVTLHLNDGDQTFSNMSGVLQHDPNGARLSLSFGMAGSQGGKASSPASLELTLPAGSDSSAPYVVRFKTGGTPLPCSLIGSYWPAAQRLGPASTFDGRITATRNAGQWKLKLSGSLRDVDLERLLEPFPHKLSGTAEIALENATVMNGQLQAAAGKLVAGPGIISRSLIHAAQQHLGVEPSRQTMLGATTASNIGN